MHADFSGCGTGAWNELKWIGHQLLWGTGVIVRANWNRGLV